MREDALKVGGGLGASIRVSERTRHQELVPEHHHPMTMLVSATTVYPFGDSQVIGRKCSVSKTSDVVDASLALLAEQLNTAIVTTDPGDMAQLDANYRKL